MQGIEQAAEARPVLHPAAGTRVAVEVVGPIPEEWAEATPEGAAIAAAVVLGPQAVAAVIGSQRCSADRDVQFLTNTAF